MRTSDSTQELAVALGKLQHQIPYIGKDAKNYQNKYTSLPNFCEKVYPVMAGLGLSMTHVPDHVNGEPALTTRLFHDSGEWIEGTFPMSRAGLNKVNDAQDMGAAFTYLIRYAKHAMLGIASGDDDAISLTQNETGPDFGPLPKPPTNKDIFTADPATLSRAQLKKRVKPLWGKMYEVEEQEKFTAMYKDDDKAGLAGMIVRVENRLNKEGG